MRIFRPDDIFSVSPLPKELGVEEGALSAYSLALGPGPVALYLYLAALPRDKEIGFLTLADATDFSLVLLAACAETLEQAGLLKTYKAKVVDKHEFYRFALVPLPSLSEIAVDPVVAELGKRRGMKNALLRVFARVRKENPESIFEEVTSLPFKEEIFGDRPKVTSEVGTNPLFSRIEFRRSFELYGFNYNSISEEELKRLETKIFRLYPLNESDYADIVADNFDPEAPEGKRINFSGVIAAAKGVSVYPQARKNLPGSNQSKVLLEMEKLECEEFFKKRLQGSYPTDSDKQLIISLRKMGLSDSCINAIFVFVSFQNNGQLPKNYIERIAGSVARKRLKKADETLDYLRNGSRVRRKKKTDDEEEKTETMNAKPATIESEEEEDIDVAALIAEMKGKK